MRRDIFHAFRLLVAPTLALVVIALMFPGRLQLSARVYALLVCASALVVVLRAVRRAYPPEHPLRTPAAIQPSRRRPPPGLARLEHDAALGVAGAFHLHFRLAPRLRAIATGLLLARRRISLDEDPTAAHEVLGDETWELVRPDRLAPDDRLGRGLSPAALAHAVEALEGI